MKHLLVLAFCIAGLALNAPAQTSKESITTVAKPEKVAEFKGGITGWINFLEKNNDRDFLKRKNAPAGQFKVTANFVIDTDGSVKDIQIEEDPGYGTADETRRILAKSSKQWIPASDKGQPVPYRHRQSLTFTN